MSTLLLRNKSNDFLCGIPLKKVMGSTQIEHDTLMVDIRICLNPQQNYKSSVPQSTGFLIYHHNRAAPGCMGCQQIARQAQTIKLICHKVTNRWSLVYINRECFVTSTSMLRQNHNLSLIFTLFGILVNNDTLDMSRDFGCHGNNLGGKLCVTIFTKIV